MSRYIDADVLLSKMVNEPVKAVDGVDFDAEWFTRIADMAVQFTDMVKNAPTVDAVQVVRCRECKYFIKNTWECARLSDRFGDEYSDARVYPEYYCADGERRENGE